MAASAFNARLYDCFGGTGDGKPSDNSPWSADELSHGTVVRSISGLKTNFDTSSIFF